MFELENETKVEEASQKTQVLDEAMGKSKSRTEVDSETPTKKEDDK